MPKIIIWDNKNILIAELEGKIENSKSCKIAKFKKYKLLQSQTIRKQLKKIETVIKYLRKKKKEGNE